MYQEQLFEGLQFLDMNGLERVKKYVQLLQPLEKISRFWEGQKYNTIAHVPYVVKEIIDFFESPVQDFEIILTLRSRIALEVRTRFGNLLQNVNSSLLAAAVHPVYGNLSFISPALQNEVWKKVKAWCDELYSTDETNPRQVLLLQQRHLILDFLRKTFESTEHQENWKVEFVYGHDLILEKSQKWWSFYCQDEENEKVFVMIHGLVKMLSSLPCTSAPAERVFSCSGFLKPPLRNRLSPYLLEYLTVIRSFIHSPLYVFETLFQNFQAILEE